MVDVNNGARFSTYVLAGARCSGVVQLNGAAARLALPGDLVIIMSFAAYDELQAQEHQPRVVLVDDQNHVVRPQLRAES